MKLVGNSLLCYVDGYNFESCRYFLKKMVLKDGFRRYALKYGFEVLTYYFAVLFAPVNAVKYGFEG